MSMPEIVSFVYLFGILIFLLIYSISYILKIGYKSTLKILFRNVVAHYGSSHHLLVTIPVINFSAYRPASSFKWSCICSLHCSMSFPILSNYYDRSSASDFYDYYETSWFY